MTAAEIKLADSEPNAAICPQHTHQTADPRAASSPSVVFGGGQDSIGRRNNLATIRTSRATGRNGDPTGSPASCSGIGLGPDNDISGGKVLWVGTNKVNNRAAKHFRPAAYTLHQCHSALGGHYRRMRVKLGSPQAITASAHKFARITYHRITTGQTYDESISRDTKRATKKCRGQVKSTGRRIGLATRACLRLPNQVS
jgi:hypothetical protein